MRLTHIENIQGKMEKLKHLSHFKSDISKLHFLDKQIENLELQIKKCSLELQILEADLRDYEVAPEQEPASLHQLSWCERNLNHSLEKIIARKNAFANMSTPSKQPIEDSDHMQMENQNGMPFPSNFNENELASTIQNPTNGEILMKLDPWISPYSAKVRESLLQDLLDQANTATPNMNPGPSNICNFPFPDSLTILESGIQITSDDTQIPLQQSSVVDLPKLPDQINADAWNNFSSMTFSDAIHMSSQALCNFQAPRFTSTTTDTNNGCTTEMSQSLLMDNCLQFASSNLNQFNNLGAEETMGQQLSMNFGNTVNGSTDVEGAGRMQRSDQGQITSDQPQKNFYHDTPFDNLPPQDALGQNMLWASKIQKSGSWDWEDLLLEDNFNFGDFSKQ